MAFVSASRQTANWFGSPVSITLPAGATTGRIVLHIAFASGTSSNNPLTAPAGWTTLHSFNAAFDSSFVVAYRVVQAGDPTSVSWSATVGTTGWVTQVVYDTTTSVADSNAARDTGGANTATAPSVAGGVSGATLVTLAVGDAAGKAPYTAPGGQTERFDDGDGSNGGSIYVGDEILSAGGATGARVVTGSSTSNSWNANVVLTTGGPPAASVKPIMGGLYGRGQGFFKPGALASQVPRNRAAQGVAYDAVFRPAAGGPTIVSGAQAGAWSVRNLASTSRGGAWSVRNLAAATTTGAWSVRNLAAGSAGSAWSVRASVSTTQAGAWSVRNLATGSATGAWSVAGLLPIVSTTLDGAWSVRALAASSQAGAWSVRNLASSTRAGAWSVRNLAAGSAASAWSIRNLVNTSAGGAWSVRNLSSTTTTGAWSVRAAVGTSVTGAWSVRNLAAGSVGAAWSVRNRVAGSKAGAWSVLNAGGYPDPADVRYGVQYGPTGTEYTGTLRGAGVVLIRRR